jgi:hypothetical protein
MVQLRLKIGKIWTLDNIFFGGIVSAQEVEIESVAILAGFLSHSWTGDGHSRRWVRGCLRGQIGIEFGIEDALQWHEKSWEANK